MSQLLFILLALSVSAQVADDRTADTVVREYNTASLKQDWSGVATLIHPDSLREFRAMLAIVIEKTPEMGSLLGVKSKGDLALLWNAQVFERLLSFV